MEARINIRVYSRESGGASYDVNIDGEILHLGPLVESLNPNDDITKLIKKCVKTALI